MNLAIPVYIEEHKVAGDPAPQFRLRPLFFDQPVKAARQLAMGMSKLAQAMRQRLDALATQPRQEEMIPWTFSPALSEARVRFSLQLRRQTMDCRFLVASFSTLERRIAFVPALGDVYFEVLRGQDLEQRARDVIGEHFRRLEKEEGEAFEMPARLATCSRAWITPLELDVHPKPSLEKAAQSNLMAILSQQKPDGRFELTRVGRCLDWLYPDELDRAVMREEEVGELLRLLAERDRRPLLLLGPRKVGKTAILHEAVYRRAAERQQSHVARQNVWLLSPARLISGMSYVGQWEGRLLAILGEAAKRDHVLYFDDVLGLYQAGQSADSDLHVAAVMRSWVERRAFRMLAEMTPDAFAVLRERDRGFADLFHILPIREPDESQTRRILIQVVRELENRHRCRFDVQALPAVIDLERRYVRDQAMPGKAAGFLAQLGLKFRQQDLGRSAVLSEFSAHSGLSIPFLDAGSRVERRHIVEALRRDIIGQDAALAAMADVVAVAKAQLNDPGRPLGTLLFLGPTGVGKTAAAKALARYLYGAESRLLRFDMNEYVDSAALARLTGTFARPEGALTSAVRRQPYCVLLLDEIEKAHPAVLDLLLSVLGEGRLTDSLGRTSDFTSAVIVMTSNLGTRQAASEFGLRPAAAASKDQVFIHAARDFFRPEFFNRIDRIVPFDPLGPEQVAAIADRLIAELFRREGLVHRRCVLDVHPAAMGRIVDGGYHPQLGARALKREIERQLTAPIAASLAQLTPEAPTVVSIVPSGEGVAPRVQALMNVRPADDGALRLHADDVDAALDRVEDFLNQVESENQEQEPAGGAGVSSDALSPEHFRYFAVREQIQRIDRLIRQIDQSAAEKSPKRNRRTPRLKPPRRLRWLEAGAPREGDLHARLAELWEAARPLGDAAPDRVIELLHEATLLRAISSAGVSRVLLGMRTVGGQDAANVKSLIDAYAHLFSRQYGFAATRLDVMSEGWRWLVLEMPGIGSVLSGEAGTHLIYPAHENVLPVQLVVVELQTGEDALAVAARCAAEIKTWLSEVADGRASPDADPFPLGPVIRIYDPSLATLDLRSGLLCPGLPRGDDLRRMIVAGLPPPPEGLRS